MAYTTHIPTSVLANIWSGVTGFFGSFARAVSVSASMDQRMHRVAELNAKTDEELAAMNLRRGDIPSYVFRDLMHI